MVMGLYIFITSPRPRKNWPTQSKPSLRKSGPACPKTERTWKGIESVEWELVYSFFGKVEETQLLANDDVDNDFIVSDGDNNYTGDNDSDDEMDKKEDEQEICRHLTLDGGTTGDDALFRGNL